MPDNSEQNQQVNVVTNSSSSQKKNINDDMEYRNRKARKKIPHYLNTHQFKVTNNTEYGPHQLESYNPIYNGSVNEYLRKHNIDYSILKNYYPNEWKRLFYDDYKRLKEESYEEWKSLFHAEYIHEINHEEQRRLFESNPTEWKNKYPELYDTLRRDNPGLFKRKFPLDPVSIPRKWQTDTASQSIDNNDFEVLIGILGIAAAAIIGCITNDSIDKPREKY